MKKILVTGGAGSIGTNLCNELRSRGHTVIACDLLNNERNDYMRCDVRHIRQIEILFDRYGPFDFVYHLAAEYGRWNGEAYFENLWETNLIGTKNILRMQERLGFKLIFFSSAEVYGDYSGVMNESVMVENPISDTYQMNDYAITKWAGELMCMNSASMFDSEIVRVRPVNCYGPHEEYTPFRGFIPKFIFHALNDKRITVHSGHKRIIDYVGDTCRTVANITDNFLPGKAYNVGGKTEWERSIEDYAQIVIEATGASKSLLDIKDPERFTTEVKTIDFSESIKDLDHQPIVAPEEGIAKTVHWMKKHYGI
ncbi:NAD-dependent epimerase/dehydratase family protein [Polynucleobacter campilacus]|uniref:Nucleoside-diphosphate sugar epimerase n=1 Tax=Polynucleobacter campilacus TaxID=1743163 RepID=A0A254PVW8_9BURK|nr:NAD(P)-dependent oxidoreductase [Polynucleobacter campilacus]OWS70693.1 nucleoside-diphosphate sugar epimerase [Polynucleobacter campilacus]